MSDTCSMWFVEFVSGICGVILSCNACGNRLSFIAHALVMSAVVGSLLRIFLFFVAGILEGGRHVHPDVRESHQAGAHVLGQHDLHEDREQVEHSVDRPHDVLPRGRREHAGEKYPSVSGWKRGNDRASFGSKLLSLTVMFRVYVVYDFLLLTLSPCYCTSEMLCV